jgi:O-antigen/teichoic acid export membrane protein
MRRMNARRSAFPSRRRRELPAGGEPALPDLSRPQAGADTSTGPLDSRLPAEGANRLAPQYDDGQQGPSTRGTLMRGSGWNALGQVAPLIINILLTPYILHALGIQGYGLFALAVTITTFFASFDGGIGKSAQRYFAVYLGESDYRAVTRLLVSLSVALAAVGALLSSLLFIGTPTILAAFGVPAGLLNDGIFLLRTLAITITLLMIQGLFSALLSAGHRFGVTSATRLVTYALYAMGVVIAVESGYGLEGIAIAMLAQAGVSAVVISIVAGSRLHWRHVGFVSWRDFRKFLAFAMRVQLVGFAGLVNNQADTLIIGAFLGIREVGLYSAGANFANQLRTVPLNALGPAQSLLGQAYGRHGARAAEAEFEKLQRLWVVATSGWFAVGVSASYFGVTAWLGGEYGLAALVAATLLTAHLVNVWTGMLTVWLGVAGRPELEARYGIIAVLLNVTLTFALVGPFGLYGVIVATAIASVASSFYLLRLVRIKYSPDLRSFLLDIPALPIAVGVCVTVSVELAARSSFPQGALGLLVAGIAAVPGVASYVIAAYGPRRTWRALSSRLINDTPQDSPRARRM